MPAAWAEWLNIQELVSEVLSTDVLVPLSGQGSLSLLGRRGETQLDSLAKKLEDAGSHRSVDIERAIETAVDRFGGLDILVCGAIHRAKGAFLDVTEEDLDRALAVNIKGYFLSVQKAVPHFRARGGGKVILISSTFGFVGAPDLSVYCTTKGSVVNMTRTLALELAQENINVNAVAPGPIKTEGMAAMIANDPTIESHRTAGMPLQRFGTPDEVAASILFLASDQARYLHGHNLVVDGGYLAV